MLGIVIAMAFIPDQRTPLALGVVSLAILLVAYAARQLFRRGAEPVVPMAEMPRPDLHEY
ncbi:hypothetical protein D3C72_1641140 [compost metagenome]